MPKIHQLFDKYHALGLPYHGLATNLVLALPNGGTVAAPQARGPSLVLRHPSAPGQARTPEEAAQDVTEGKAWRTYALLSGRERQLGGSLVGSAGWIYIDPAGNAWQLSAAFEPAGVGSTSREYVITLVRQFGVIRNPAPVDINRELYRETYTFSEPGVPDPADYDGWKLYPVPNEDGSRCLCNVYDAPLDDIPLGRQQGERAHDIDEWQISGSGSTDPATLGDGITATRLSRERWPHSSQSQNFTVSAARWCGKNGFNITGTPGVDYKKIREFENQPVNETYTVSDDVVCFGAVYHNGVKSKVVRTKQTTDKEVIETFGPGEYICRDDAGGPTGPDPAGWSGLSGQVTLLEKVETWVTGGGINWHQVEGTEATYVLGVQGPSQSACCDDDGGSPPLPLSNACVTWTPNPGPGSVADARDKYRTEDGLSGFFGAGARGVPIPVVQDWNGVTLLTTESAPSSTVFNAHIGYDSGMFQIGGAFDQLDLGMDFAVALNPETGETAHDIAAAIIAYF